MSPHYDDLKHERERLASELEPLMEIKQEAIEARQQAIETVKSIAEQTNPIEARISELDELLALGADRVKVLTELTTQVIGVSPAESASEVSAPNSN